MNKDNYLEEAEQLLAQIPDDSPILVEFLAELKAGLEVIQKGGDVNAAIEAGRKARREAG